MRLLRKAAPEGDVLASVRNACLFIQPSCGMDTYQAAIQGGLLSFHNCTVSQTSSATRAGVKTGLALALISASWILPLLGQYRSAFWACVTPSFCAAPMLLPSTTQHSEDMQPTPRGISCEKWTPSEITVR